MNGVTLLAAMLAAVHAQHSAHYVTTTVSGATKVVIVGDVAKTSGKQEITFTRSGRSGHVSVRVVNGTAYFRGDAFALQDFMGVPAANAVAHAGDWVRVPKTAKQYASVAAAVTMGSFAASLGVNGTVTKVAGGLAITTSTGAAVRLFLTSKHLPTRETGKGSGGTLALTVGRWNEPVRVSPPAKTVAVDAVYRTSPGA
jgi:hypothetical protein